MTDRKGMGAAWRSLAIAALLLMATAAIYAPGLGGGFIFDDFPNIVDNPQVQPKHISMASLAGAAMSSPSSELKRPLSSLTFALDYLLAGELNASSMKVTNVALHALNGILLYFLFASLFRFQNGGKASETRVDLLAAVSSLAWLLLPINITAVLYVVQRMESLANLFVLAGLLGYVRTRVRMQRGQSGLVRAFAWILIPALFGTLAKETSVLLPLYGLCTEAFAFRFRSGGATSRPDRRLAWFYALILGAPIAFGMVWLGPGLLDSRTWATRDFTLQTRLLSEARVVLDYLGWTIVPTRDALTFYHDAFLQSTGWLTPPSTLLSALALLLIGCLLWLVRKKAPLVTLGGSWFFACHTLTGTVLPLELVYEHRNYFASIGIVLIVADGLRYASMALLAKGKTHPLLPFAPAIIGVALLGWSALLTARTAQAWGSPLSLAEELAERGPQSHRAQYELGRAYIIASHYDPDSPFISKARVALERAAALPDSSILAEQALIFMYGRMNLPVQAAWWSSMQRKLSQQPITVQDDSALLALASCVEQSLCRFSTVDLDNTFHVALAGPSASARLKSAYGTFATRILRNEDLAFRMASEAVKSSPAEPAYRINYVRMLLKRDDVDEARRQLATLDAMNFGGRLNADIDSLKGDLENRVEDDSAGAPDPGKK